MQDWETKVVTYGIEQITLTLKEILKELKEIKTEMKSTKTEYKIDELKVHEGFWVGKNAEKT